MSQTMIVGSSLYCLPLNVLYLLTMAFMHTEVSDALELELMSNDH